MYEEPVYGEDENVVFDELYINIGDDLYLEVKLNNAFLIIYAKAYYLGENGEILLGGRQTFQFAEELSSKKFYGFSYHFRVETRQGLKDYNQVALPMVLEGVRVGNDCLILPS